jgi:predicted RNase H-like HicB family nuclease
MKAIYPALFRTESVGGYSVVFPDLDGCITEGDDLKHALEMAQEAMGLYLVSLEEDKTPIPNPSGIEEIETKQGEFVNLVMVEVNKYRRGKSVNKMLTLPAWLNEAGEAAHINFSGVLQEALKQKLGYE